ncbi:YybH family protein [Methylibium rhizosphaerae]|uniref:YybH family protein n=1 Tax=Methylibium rhizosphaerae TaxID=2570323 RepID=UPI00112BB3C3|nr:SgcJ/EcaC family oxidoreductase [Methylibium rhizosphaerae]
MSPEETEIRRLIADAQQHQFNVAELMELHDDDAVVINMAGRRLFGKPAFREAMEQALASSLQHVPTVTEIDRVYFVAPGCAVVSCTKTVLDQRPQAEQTALPGSVGLMTYVLVQKQGRWVIASAQTTPLVR